MAQVLQDMLWADVTVWSFPLYYFSVPGPVKNLMDRQLPMSLPFMSADSETGGHPSRHDMTGKRTVVISTCGFYTAEGNYDGVTAVFDHLCGKGNYTTIFCGQGELFRVPELKQQTESYLADVQQAGREFASCSISTETSGKLKRLLFPREVFEAMADASWGVEKESGEKADETAVFTRQMAALYNRSSFDGKERILEMYYTDVDKRYQLILGKDGCQVLDKDFRTATTRIETPYTLWKAIASGEETGQDALMQGKYRVKGDFDLMIYWDRYFGVGSEEAPAATQEKPTNMALLLIPWITFWVTTSIRSGASAALISIAVSALAPLVLYKYRMIVFDTISAACVTLCSLALLLEFPLTTVLPLSYLGFGLLWTVNGLRKMPLTAHYSANDYGGEGIKANPLFLKTNRILTLCWGLLYLAMTVWTIVMFRFGVTWIGTVNSLLPMALSIFTAWFQKWYPAYVARGK
jgi:multimeric flavodoxin WrbA